MEDNNSQLIKKFNNVIKEIKKMQEAYKKCQICGCKLKYTTTCGKCIFYVSNGC